MVKLGNLVQFGFAVLMIIIFISCSFRGATSYGLRFGFVIIALGAAGVIYGFKKLGTLAKKHVRDEKTADRCVFVMACVMLCVQLFFGANLSFAPITDLANADRAARQFCVDFDVGEIYKTLPPQLDEYFAMYPNNQTLLIILSLVYKLQFTLTGTMTRAAPIFLNVCALNLSFVFLYKTGKELYPKNVSKPLAAAAAGFFLSAFYTYAPFYYTDSLSMPFVVISLFCFLRAVNCAEKSLKRSALNLTLSAFALSFGFYIKGSVAILLVAFVMFGAVFGELSAKKRVFVCVYTLVMSILFIGILAVFRDMFKIATASDYEKYKFPLWHWIMMGLRSRGGFSWQDFNFTRSFPDFDAKKAADIGEIKARAEFYGAGGLFFHSFKKLSYTWADGSYLIFYHIGSKGGILRKFIQESAVFRYLCSFYHFGMLGLITKSFFDGYEEKKISRTWLLRIIFAGVVIFFSIWETRSRYIVNFTPIMVLLAADAADGTRDRKTDGKKV